MRNGYGVKRPIFTPASMESGFYAYCLDGDKAKVLTVTSNPGHLLWSGIVPRERAERVVRRLMLPDMWSGRGIRTLSADHPSFNPFSYQNACPRGNYVAMDFQKLRNVYGVDISGVVPPISPLPMEVLLSRF
jgi:hypothetical protein